jgi:hypothetical protein
MWREADHSRPSGIEVKKVWTNTSSTQGQLYAPMTAKGTIPVQNPNEARAVSASLITANWRATEYLTTSRLKDLHSRAAIGSGVVCGRSHHSIEHM